MEDAVNSSVRTEATSWNRRTLAAPLSRAPLLLSCTVLRSPDSRLMRSTRSALQIRQCGQCLHSWVSGQTVDVTLKPASTASWWL